LNSDYDLEPIQELKARVERMGEEVGSYPKMKVGDQVSM